MVMQADTCYICNEKIIEKHGFVGLYDSYICIKCGLVRISTTASAGQIYDLPEYKDRKHFLSGVLCEMYHLYGKREYQPITSDNIDEFFKSPLIPKDFSQASDKLLIYLRNESKHFGASIIINSRKLQAVLYAKNDAESNFLQIYLIENGLIGKPMPEGVDEIRFKLTTKGWDRIYEIEKGRIKSNQGFVAMSFNPSLKEIYDNHIKLAIENTGFSSFRTDGFEHNEKIDDLIISEIKKSQFLIADVTEQKQGVYFEAGYAMGIGLPVVWMCRKDDLEKVHFDTRQFNYIVWENGQELQEKLEIRIRSTIPGAKWEMREIIKGSTSF